MAIYFTIQLHGKHTQPSQTVVREAVARHIQTSQAPFLINASNTPVRTKDRRRLGGKNRHTIEIDVIIRGRMVSTVKASGTPPFPWAQALECAYQLRQLLTTQCGFSAVFIDGVYWWPHYDPPQLLLGALRGGCFSVYEPAGGWFSTDYRLRRTSNGCYELFTTEW
ncbi:MAG TPA: hypothetical protein VNG90_01775 [Candidatus Acidoferrum sp.]|nr:hypothetical protein [Candidatus Acidoferrum sp.]